MSYIAVIEVIFMRVTYGECNIIHYEAETYAHKVYKVSNTHIAKKSRVL